MALLALVADFIKIVPRGVIVHHCHHGVIAAADDWLTFVAAEAKRRNCVFKAHRLALEMGPGFEARAREARYDSVMSEVKSGDVVMTAHHRDDQVETLVYNALKSKDDIAELAVDELQDIIEITEKKAADIIMKARESWFN